MCADLDALVVVIVDELVGYVPEGRALGGHVAGDVAVILPVALGRVRVGGGRGGVRDARGGHHAHTLTCTAWATTWLWWGCTTSICFI